MRVMQVIYSFEVGGAESVARDIALSISASHAIAALERDGPLKKFFDANNIKSYIINRQPTERLSPMFRLWKAMRDFKPDVVHTHQLYMLFYAWPGAMLAGARIVHTEHQYHSLLGSKARFRLRQLSRFCSAVTGVNEETSAFLRKQIGIPTHKVHTVVNGMDLDRYKTTPASRGEIGLSEDDLVAGIVARLNPVKDHSMLLQAFRQVVNQQPRAKLLVIGDGEERASLEQQTLQLNLDQNVRFLGMRSDVPDLLACIDVVVLSSRNEGLPLCILEAMATGKPVIATRVGGIPSVVRPGETGMLVDSGDIASMATALLTLLNDRELGKLLGINGRKLIEERYDLKKSAADYYSLYVNAERK